MAEVSSQVKVVSVGPVIEMNACIRCGEAVGELAMCHECALAVINENTYSSTTLRWQHYITLRAGIDHPLRAYDVLLAAWIKNRGK